MAVSSEGLVVVVDELVVEVLVLVEVVVLVEVLVVVDEVPLVLDVPVVVVAGVSIQAHSNTAKSKSAKTKANFFIIKSPLLFK